jgi:transcriptional regulator with XRE-family HTH domain
MKKQRHWAERFAQLRSFVQITMTILSETPYLGSFRDMADVTGLSESTVRRLHAGNFTGAMRVETLQKLAKAAGLELTLTQDGVELRLGQAA